MLNSIFSAFLMYSRIPAPKVEWSDKNRRYALGFFPLVGLFVGGFMVLWRLFCTYFSAGQFIFAAGCTAIPILVTGGIHLDGYCDVTDAKSSYADHAKRLEILSDPHIGSFAVMKVCLYLIVQTALFSRITGLNETLFVGCGFILSRALSCLSAVLFKAAKREGTLQSFVKPSHRSVTIGLGLGFAAVSAITVTVLFPICGIVCTVAAAAVMIFCRKTAYREFGGYTGDVCGWFLQLCEIAVLAAFVLTKMVTEVLL